MVIENSTYSSFSCELLIVSNNGLIKNNVFWKLTTENEEVEFNFIPFTWISDNLTVRFASNISEKSPIKPHPTTVDMENWMSSLHHLCEASHFLFSV